MSAIAEPARRLAAELSAHRPVALFSMEMALHEPLTAGALGIVAADLLRAAAELGVPMVGVGLLYRSGSFEQPIGPDGQPGERHPRWDPAGGTPEGSLVRVHGDEAPLTITVETGDAPIVAAVWELRQGDVRVVLLDPEPTEADPLVTRLHPGDRRQRLRQELLLGVGGFRALAALGIEPPVIHLHEAHGAFAGLEAIAQRIALDQGEQSAPGRETFEGLRIAFRERTVLAVHSAIRAGHDRYPPALVLEQLRPLRSRLGLDEEAFAALGSDAGPLEGGALVPGQPFSMSALGLRLAGHTLAASLRHRRATRRLFHELLGDHGPSSPGRDPLRHQTCGVHLPTWAAAPTRRFLGRELGPDWKGRRLERATWAPLEAAGDAAVWAFRTELRATLRESVRERAAREARERGEGPAIVQAQEEALDAEDLVVASGHRFATYQRMGLLFEDLDALARLVDDPVQPLRLVVSGKAHPRDARGRALLQRVFQASREPRFLGKVVVLEGWGLELGRVLTAGADVWLDTARRPPPGPGSWAQMAALNGALVCAPLDGWWAEAYDGTHGFAIGEGEAPADPELQDARDAEALRDVLARVVAPLFHWRRDGLPVGWIPRVRRGMLTIGGRFDSLHSVAGFAREAYLPAVFPRGGGGEPAHSGGPGAGPAP